MKRLLTGLSVLLVALAIVSCNKNNDQEKLRKIELEKLAEYIEQNYPDETQKPSGLYYIETQKGIGDTIKFGDRVQIFYSAQTIDSLLVDETSGYSIGHRFEPVGP